jgi:hypothetical protein
LQQNLAEADIRTKSTNTGFDVVHGALSMIQQCGAASSGDGLRAGAQAP